MSITAPFSSGRRMLEIAGHLVSPRQSAMALHQGLTTFWRNRALAWEMVRRDIAGQYANQALGSFWVFAHPLSLLLIYVFVFVVVLKVKVPEDAAMPRDYTSYILAGLVPWLTIAQSLGRSSTALISQANLVKQVVFPVEVLPPASVIVSLTPMAICVPAIVAYQFFNDQGVPLTIVLTPLVIAGMFLFLTGIGYLLSAITPFFRDLKDIVTVFVTAGVYLIPAFYLPAWVPPLFKPVILLNPFSYPILVCQDILYYGRIQHPSAWVIFFVMAVVSFVAGYRVFRRISPFVATVL